MIPSTLVATAASGEAAPREHAFWMFVALALTIHIVAVRAVPVSPARAPVTADPLEVELGTARPSAPAIPPPPTPQAVAPLPSRVPSSRPDARLKNADTPAKAIAEPARAGALLHAGEAQAADDPIAFVTDENGEPYGSGVVARGGTAARGEDGARVTAHASSLARGVPARGGLTPERDLRRKPALDAADACRGYFPPSATSDVAVVSLAVVVQADGRVSQTTVLDERPTGEQFGDAAKACLSAQRFAPGLDASGSAVATSTAVRLRFVR